MGEIVQLEVGQIVDVTLESMMGSTGYGWELTSLQPGVNLMAIQTCPTSTRGVAPVMQVFHFRGIKEGTAEATFALNAPWKVEDPYKTVTYTFKVSEAEEASEDDLKKTMNVESFVAPPSSSIRATIPIPPYGVPSDQMRVIYSAQPPTSLDPRVYYGVCCSPDISGDPRVFYGCPPPSGDPRLYYGICPPATNSAPDSCVNPPQVLKYGMPPMMRYNYPPQAVKYGIPPVARYNFPPTPDYGVLPDGCC